MQLSERLNTVVSMVKPCRAIADVGTDHGYVPVFLVRAKTVEQAVAMDVRKGPLSRAREHVREAGLSGQIELRLSDGLEKLVPGEVSGAVIAGMGGMLMLKILEEGLDTANSMEQLILSPQSDLKLVRRWLEGHGFYLEEERLVLEEGKFYTVMRAVKGKEALTEEEAAYGPRLLENREPLLGKFLEKEKEKRRRVLEALRKEEGQNAAKRREELEKELKLIQKAEQRMEEHTYEM